MPWRSGISKRIKAGFKVEVNAVELNGLLPEWPAPAGVRAAFTLRGGGVSSAPYDTLNLGAHVGDDPASVRENRRRLREMLRLPTEPVWLEQVHGTAVFDLDGVDHAEAAGGESARSDAASLPSPPLRVAIGRELGDESGQKPPGHSRWAGLPGEATTSAVRRARADAATTHRSGRVCVIQVADCMPVLFAARNGSAVGAAHAGWRGLAGGVLEATARSMRVPPRELLVWLGPAISQENFEVGEDVRSAFVAADAGAASAFLPNTRGRWQCDLYELGRRRLAALGVENVFGGGWCTYADPARFFSFRRDGQCGRMAALIWLE